MQANYNNGMYFKSIKKNPKSDTIMLIKRFKCGIGDEETVPSGAREIESKGEKQCDGEEERGSGGGEEARGNRPSLHHPCAAFVFVMHGSHFDLQPSLSAEIEGSGRSRVK